MSLPKSCSAPTTPHYKIYSLLKCLMLLFSLLFVYVIFLFYWAGILTTAPAPDFALASLPLECEHSSAMYLFLLLIFSLALRKSALRGTPAMISSAALRLLCLLGGFFGLSSHRGFSTTLAGSSPKDNAEFPSREASPASLGEDSGASTPAPFSRPGSLSPEGRSHIPAPEEISARLRELRSLVSSELYQGQ